MQNMQNRLVVEYTQRHEPCEICRFLFVFCWTIIFFGLFFFRFNACVMPVDVIGIESSRTTTKKEEKKEEIQKIRVNCEIKLYQKWMENR